MSKPIVAVVGRPNVGKSTLFNKLCGQRLAIVEDTPGITRDRIFANCEWNGHDFLLVDTGGIEPKATEGILAHMREQAQIAIDTADCIIMVVDVRDGLTAADEDVAHMLRRSHKPIILAVNKCDKVGDAPMEMYEFYNLGFDEVMPISSVHGHGTGDLLDAVCAHLDFSETVVEEDRIPVAIIGRPNVGKSSLTNRILGENRMIVANEAGTTRIMVTDSAGLVVYDTRQGNDAVGEYALYSVIASALKGSDTFYRRYDGEAFLSRMATPVVYHSQTVGAVYAYDYDTEQAALLQSFRSNLLTISVMIALLVTGLSIMLSRMLTRQISGLLQAIRNVREGAYSHRADASGTDEIAQIAAEFNSLTDRLQTTEDARRRFVSDASHELKTPLAGIRLLTDSILQTDNMDPETTKEFVTDIGREAERLSRITENLLRLTRLDGGVVPSAYPVAVGPVLQRVERMLGMVAAEKGVAISGAVSEDAVALATDDDVHQILYNLMENAIKYSAPENGFVRVEASVRDGQVVIHVTDTGRGIPREFWQSIFQPFFRVDKSLSRELGGAGLGLPLVWEIARLHGGRVWVEESNDNGSALAVTLPLSASITDTVRR